MPARKQKQKKQPRKQRQKRARARPAAEAPSRLTRGPSATRGASRRLRPGYRLLLLVFSVSALVGGVVFAVNEFVLRRRQSAAGGATSAPAPGETATPATPPGPSPTPTPTPTPPGTGPGPAPSPGATQGGDKRRFTSSEAGLIAFGVCVAAVFLFLLIWGSIEYFRRRARGEDVPVSPVILPLISEEELAEANQRMLERLQREADAEVEAIEKKLQVLYDKYDGASPAETKALDTEVEELNKRKAALEEQDFTNPDKLLPPGQRSTLVNEAVIAIEDAADAAVKAAEGKSAVERTIRMAQQGIVENARRVDEEAREAQEAAREAREKVGQRFSWLRGQFSRRRGSSVASDASVQPEPLGGGARR